MNVADWVITALSQKACEVCSTDAMKAFPSKSNDGKSLKKSETESRIIKEPHLRFEPELGFKEATRFRTRCRRPRRNLTTGKKVCQKIFLIKFE